MNIPLHSSAEPQAHVSQDLSINPLPRLLRTPSGLALLELQGTINLPDHDDEGSIATGNGGGGLGAERETPIGRLVFPDYVEGEGGQGWMQRVYLYVGKHQRLTGEVKKLPKAVAIIRKRAGAGGGGGAAEEMEGVEGVEGQEELEIVEIVKFKILFSTRPEPVGTWAVGD